MNFLLKKVLCSIGFLAIFSFCTNFSFAEKIIDLKPANYVNDYAQVLDNAQEVQINQQLKSLEDQTGAQITIVTVKNLDGDYIEHYAVKLFEAWKIGNAKLDNGALLLVAIDDRQMRLEVGYGLEPVLTDGFSRSLLDNVLKPAFQQGDYAGGLASTASYISDRVNGGAVIESNTSNKTNNSVLNLILNLLPFIFFLSVGLISWLGSVLGRTKSWWLGGIIGSVVGGVFIFVIGVGLVTGLITSLLTILGLVFDYFVSKNYQAHKSGWKSDPPDWWAGSTWGPGSSPWTGSSGGSSWGGFGGGSSGGGGASSSW